MVDIGKFVNDIENFLRERVYPREPVWLAKPFVEIEHELFSLRREVKARGWWAPYLPIASGGSGLALLDYARVSEVLGTTPYGHYVFHCQAPDVGNIEVLLSHGTDEQRATFLEPLVKGLTRSCFAMTEPEHAGSNPTWLSTEAVREGDSYVLNGHKWFTTGADGAAFAIVMAVTDPAAAPHLRASQILVPTDAEGFERVRNLPVMGAPEAGWPSHSEVRLTNCRVPLGNRIGDEGAGFRIAQERLGPGRIHHCMRWVGIMQRAIELTAKRAHYRETAPGEKLADKQAIVHLLADSQADYLSSRLLVLDAATQIDKSGMHAAREAISLIKFVVAQALGRVLDRSIQVHGALGMLDETPLAYWYRHERAARIYDGADEVHKNVVGKAVLRSAVGRP